MRVKYLLAALAVPMCGFSANLAQAGTVAGQTYIYVANDSGSDTISISPTTGGTATTLANTATGSDPHQIAIGGSSGQFLFVTNDSGLGTVSEFNTAGDLLSSAFITAANNNGVNSAPVGLAVSGSDLFVADFSTHSIGEYTFNPATGALTGSNANFISLPTGSGPFSLAISGNNLYAAASSTGQIYGFTTSGATLGGFTTITDTHTPEGLVVDGSGNLFVANEGNNSIGEYNATTGLVEHAALVTNGVNSAKLNSPAYLALNTNGDLLVSNHSATVTGTGPNTMDTYTVGEYTTSGTTVNSAFISTTYLASGTSTGLEAPFGIAVGVATVPLPNSAAAMGSLLGLVALFGYRRSIRQRSQVAR